jgi:serine phosphatase RsbU (regulator of sigma subunit)/FixJ family two-component response regulator
VTRKLNILLVEDEPADAAIIVRRLTRAGIDGEFERVQTADEVRRFLAAGAIDLVIADYSLPSFNGIDSLPIIAELGLDVPLIIVSGTIDAPTALAAMKAGAKDFVLKDHLEQLPEIVERELAEAEARGRRRRVEAERDNALRELRRELDTTNRVLEAAEALAASRTLSDVLTTLADILLNATSHTRVIVSLSEGEPSSLVVWVSAGLEPVPAGLSVERPQLSDLAVTTLDSRRAALVDFDASGGTAELRNAKIVSHLALVMPLVFGDRVLGMLTIDDPEQRREFGEREIALVEGIAANAAVAIENARLLEAEQRSTRIAEALNAVNEILLSTITVDEMLDRIVSQSASAIGADRALVADLDHETILVRRAAGFPPELVGKRFRLSEFPVMERAVRERVAAFVGDVGADAVTDLRFAREHGDAAFVTLPLIVGETVIGALTYTYNTPQRFDDRDVEFARRLSVALSLALENARHYEAEHRIAETLQAALLALPADIPGLSFAHSYHSAAQTAQVGGDFYDLFELDQGLLGVTVGDISGKGLDAAVLTSLVKNSIRAHATEKGKSPADVMRLVNRILLHETPTEVFATVFFAILDRRDGRLVYCNAGHTSAIVLRNGEAANLPPNSPLAGAYAEAPFKDSETRLELGAMLFLYTDGLVEARRDGEMFGEDRLVEALGEASDESVGAIVDRVISAAVSFAGGTVSDDLAVLALRRTETPPEIPMQQKFPLA